MSNFGKTIMKGVGRELAKHRKAIEGCSQKSISEYLGISDETLSHYENGKVSIPFDTILVLCMRYEIKQIHFSSGFKDRFGDPIDVDLHLETVGLSELERGLRIADNEHCRYSVIYEYINAIKKYDKTAMGEMILQLYLKYLAGFKSKSGKRLCDKAIMNIEAAERAKASSNFDRVNEFLLSLETVKKPQTRADYIDGLSVDVKAL